MKQIAFVALIGWIGFVSCVAPEEEFYEKVFSCDASKGDADCGTDRSGRPMTCYPGHLLHGDDFCAQTCDPEHPPGDARFACIDAIGSSQSGVLVQRCQPSRGAASCPKGLSCYRTDALADEGLCVSTRVCSTQTDCSGTGVTCGSELAAAIGGASLGVRADNLHCVQKTCSTEHSRCLPDEACLFDSFASGTVLPDICVPKCDGLGRCPPNFSCAKKPHAPGSPEVCVPGIAGITCNKSQDCLVGDCLDTGAGFSVCTLPQSCAANDYCAELDQPADRFTCTEGVAGQAICVSTRPYGGGNCDGEPGSCPEGQECFFYSAYTSVPMHGDCKIPCPDGHCETRGGIPYFCAGAQHEGGCSPTDFGFPCYDDSDCFAELQCLEAGPDPRSLHNYSPRICTLRCADDADCDGSRITGKFGFCESNAGICRRRGAPGSPCDRDAQCTSGHCSADAGCLE